MLRLFREIRKKLMNQNKIRAYLLYATGEIFLVVIGILIALQINNWNQEKQNRMYEITMLNEISLALQSDIAEMKESLLYLDRVQHSVVELVSIKENPSHPRDSLMYHFQIANTGGIAVVFNSSPYEALKSSGLDKISDPELRKNLPLLYEIQLGSVEGWINEVIREQLLDRNDFSRQVFTSHVLADSNSGIRVEYEPLSYDWVNNSPDFEIFLTFSGSYIPMAKTRIQYAIKSMQKVQSQIDSIIE